MNEQTLTLSLNVHEANVVLQALANLPYGQVFELIQKIQGQCQPQLAPAQE